MAEGDGFVTIGHEEKPTSLSMTTSQDSTSSEGLVLITSEVSSSGSGEEVGSSGRRRSALEEVGSNGSRSALEEVGSSEGSSEVEEEEGVDGLMYREPSKPRPGSGRVGGSHYSSTFTSMFSGADPTSSVLHLALHGGLRGNPFRSVCWRLLLHVLPPSPSSWPAALDSLRRSYATSRRRVCAEGRLRDPGLDPTLSHPLSQDSDSPWNQHFQDSELRRVIWQDVARTFPEVEYFQRAAVREAMVTVLFVYARTHPATSYRQGMHELLAPVMFVVHGDLEAHGGRPDGSQVPEELFGREWAEADTFALFEAVMECVGPWYRTAGEGRGDMVEEKGGVVEALTYIQDVLLRRHDPALHQRLVELEVLPQIYGIRWLRLLFGREFVLADTLEVWDAVLADPCPPSLADQLTVSLLMALRQLLLKYDYPDAVQLLMKLPSNLCVRHVVASALHLRDPLRFPRPSTSPFLSGVGGRLPRLPPTSRVPRRAPARPAPPRDMPDFTVVEASQVEEGLRERLVVEVSALTHLLAGERLQHREEVFGHLRTLADLANSLPAAREPEARCHDFTTAGQVAKVYDFTPSGCGAKEKKMHSGESGEEGRRRSRGGEGGEGAGELCRNTSLACDVSTYFEEE